TDRIRSVGGKWPVRRHGRGADRRRPRRCCAPVGNHMRSLEDFDRWIAEKVKRLSGAATERRELPEVRRDILEDVRRHIEPKGGGKYVFPYNEVAIHLAAEDDTRREMLEASLCDEQTLANDIRELLSEVGCPLSRDFQVSIDLDAAPFGVMFRNRRV